MNHKYYWGRKQLKVRKFLFLQGMASPFFSRLAIALKTHGHEVYRINFCGGDLAFSFGHQAWNYQMEMEALPCYIQEKFRRYQFTDIILFGDTRPVNKPAINIAKEYNARTYVFEEGYIRPNWVTLEANGVNGYSELPKDPDWYREHSPNLPDYHDGLPTGYKLNTRLFQDIRYRLANFLYGRRFEDYKTHRPYKAHLEYMGWTKRFSSLSLQRQDHKANTLINDLTRNQKSFFVFPLQLNSDAQIQTHSPFSGIKEAISHVLRSFSQYAKTDDLLVIKNHPLDTGLINYLRHIKKEMKTLGLDDRVFYIDGGHLPTLLKFAQGTVLINSTVGTSALYHECPTCVLGSAIYDMPGLTYQDGIDSFWIHPEKPDNKLFHLVRKAIIHKTQINGDFYTDSGIAMTIEGSLRIMNITLAGKAVISDGLVHIT